VLARDAEATAANPAPTVFAPISLDRIEAALATAAGWIELGIVLIAFAIGWLIDRRFDRRRDDAPRAGFTGSVSRLAMPLVALLVLLLARAIWRRWLPSLFLDVGVLLALALAAIRIGVYVLRRLVPDAAWLIGSERTVIWTVWVLVALQLLGIAPHLADELDALRLPIGANEVTLLTIAKGAIAVLLALALTLWLSGLVERRLMKSELDLSQRALASKFVRATLLVVGMLIAFQAIGFDLTLLSVFGGALGVGIGLGLQKLASNYIAGFVILMERSTRLGDRVTVDNRVGVVTEVTSRYVVVMLPDGVRAIVPNETMVTTTVLNHSMLGREARIAITVQVANDSEVDRALTIMADVAGSDPRVQTEGGKAPSAMVLRFTGTGIELELAVSNREPDVNQALLRSDLCLAVWKAFRDAGIALASPQREVRIVGGGADTR
jgi:small-conductance mechanosensitive channel